MISLISDNLEKIVALCREYRMRKLEVFGSAVTGSFNPETSDVDFIVDVGGYEDGVSRRYLDFIAALEDLLDRQIDLVTDDSITNPYFREAVDEQKVLIYEAGDREAAA